MRNETPYLPQEIVRNILVRLPVKSLIRFQCVCQDWKNLFKTPCFIAEHRHHSTQQNSLLVTDCYISKCIADTWHLSILNREMQFLEFRNPPIADTFGPLWRTIHSSNGLLCLDLIITNGPYNSFMLWNPALREVRQVPHVINDSEKSDDSSVGFGFSPVVNDYKIVKLSLLDRMVVEVEVYALRTGFWRKVKLGNLEVTTIKSDHGFPCNGSIFWYGLKEYDRIDVIVSFDIAIEVFTLIPFPTESLAFELSPFRLTMYDNKLALVSAIRNNESSLFIELWLIEECTNEPREGWIWTKIYTSRSCPCWSLSPMIIWRNEIVCSVHAIHEMPFGSKMKNDEAKVLLCNLTTNEFSMFAFPTKCDFTNRLLDYAESLVPLSNIKIEGQ